MAYERPACIEVRSAYEWTCEDCGRDNFVRAMAAELTPEDIEGLLEADIDPDDIEKGDWILCPTTVTCQYCGINFNVC